MMAASVDDLPDPVGPGHEHDAVLERGRVGNRRRQFRSASVGICEAITRMTMA